MIWLQPQSEPPTRDPLLNRVVENVRRYERTLPSLTADENIHSELQQVVFHRARRDATATIHVMSHEGSLREVRTYLTANGKPLPGNGKQPVPFEYTGGFSTLLSILLSQKRVGCYNFAGTPEPENGSVVVYSVTPRQGADTDCLVNGAAPHGQIAVDVPSGEVRHLEVDLPVPGKNSSQLRMSSMACDYAPAKLGTETFWLPTLMTARLNGNQGIFVANYSNYHRYVGSVTILPGSPIS